MPTGSIELFRPAPEPGAALGADQATWPRYGDTISFDTTVDGKLAKHSRVYIAVVCEQGDTVVYQYSGDPSLQFPLADQPGQGLEWDGADATCSASLLYRVEKGRAYQTTVLDSTAFTVSA